MTIPIGKTNEMENMRKKWFEWVHKTRKKMLRKDKSTTHRKAMKAASVTWPKEKVKIQNRFKREQRKLAKEQQSREKSVAVPPAAKQSQSTSAQSK